MGFATGPGRPDPTGLHRVRIFAVNGVRMLVNDLKAIKESHPILDITPVIDPATDRLERARPCPIAPSHPSRGRLSSAFDLIWQSMWLASLLAGGLLAGAIGIRAVYYSGAALLAAGGYRAASVWSSRKQQQQRPGPSGLRPGRANGRPASRR